MNLESQFEYTQKRAAFSIAVAHLIANMGPAYHITLAFNRPVGLQAASDHLREFHWRLDRAVLGRNIGNKADRRSFGIAVAEHLTTNLHFHIALACGADHLGKVEGLSDGIWRKLIPAGDALVRKVENAVGLGHYLNKEIGPDYTDQILFLNVGNS